MNIILKNKFLYFENYKLQCSVGKSGISSKKKEGDNKTPRGNFKFKYILYRKDRIPNLKTKLKKIVICKNMAWCDDPNSKYYNQMVRLPFKGSVEKLWLKNNIEYSKLSFISSIVLLKFLLPITNNLGLIVYEYNTKK